MVGSSYADIYLYLKMINLYSTMLFIAAAIFAVANLTKDFGAINSAFLQLLAAGSVIYAMGRYLRPQGRALTSSCWLLTLYVLFGVVIATGNKEILAELLPGGYETPTGIFLTTIFTYYTFFPSIILIFELMVSMPPGYGWKMKHMVFADLYAKNTHDVSVNSHVLRALCIICIGGFTYLYLHDAVSIWSLIVGMAICSAGLAIGCLAYTNNLIRKYFKQYTAGGLKEAIKEISQATKYSGFGSKKSDFTILIVAFVIFSISLIFNGRHASPNELITIAVSVLATSVMWFTDIALIRIFAAKHLQCLSGRFA